MCWLCRPFRPATVLGLAAALISLVAPSVAALLCQVAAIACWWIVRVARVAAALPTADLTAPSGGWGLLVVLAVDVAAVLGRSYPPGAAHDRACGRGAHPGIAGRESMRSMSAAAAPPPTVTLVSGSDDLLISRAIGKVVSAARASDPMAEVSDFLPGQFTSDEALTLNNPSLFGGWRVAVVRGVQDLPEEVGAVILGFAKEPIPEVALVLTASGRASALVNALRKLKVNEVKAAPITQPWKRAQFAADEARGLGGRITEDAAQGARRGHRQ